MWTRVRNVLEPLSEPERDTTFEEVVLSVQGQLVMDLNNQIRSKAKIKSILQHSWQSTLFVSSLPASSARHSGKDGLPDT